MATTRRILEVVPEREAAWRPHPKSTSLGDLASHIATIPVYSKFVAERPEVDLGLSATSSMTRIPFTTTAELVQRFDRDVAEAKKLIGAVSDDSMRESWSLKNGGTTVFSLPRIAVFRSFVLSHLIHHRGQLTVYLRLRDVPVPSVYGPTADTQ
jgi:uncharacterized damage-inducible protein DinB